MSFLRLEARVSALEQRQTNTEIRIEEVFKEMTNSIAQLADKMEAGFKNIHDDMEESFKQFTEYLMKTEEETEKRFNKIETTLEIHSEVLNRHTQPLPSRF
jgi:BMFP domain-containing protein YqiC